MKTTNNNELKSSLKNYDFKGWTSDKIIEKYEQILSIREKQIEDLSLEFGNVYKDNSQQNDLLTKVQEELLIANKKIIKLVKNFLFIYLFFVFLL
jgi:phage-related minor tail protein